MAKMQTVHSLYESKVVIVGSMGRLGRLIRPFWSNTNTVWHARNAMDGWVSLDILEETDRLLEVFEGANTIICLAGITPNTPNGNLKHNTLLAEACMNAAEISNVKRVFLTSTAAVYGNQTGPLTEDRTVQPLSDYGRSKVDMEMMAAAHKQTSTALRIGNVAGADAILGNWHVDMAIEELSDMTTPRRSYIGPATLARVLSELSELDDLPATLNIAAPDSIHMNELLDHAGLAYTRKPATDRTIADVKLDTKLLQKIIKFDLEHSLSSVMVNEWQQAVAAK